MAVPNGTPKYKFNRIYMAYNPNNYAGPPTQILDTIVKPIPPNPLNDDTARNN